MRVFVYEFITGGGLLASGAQHPVAPSLVKEGAAMVAALTADFDALHGVEVLAMRDRRLAVPLPAGCRTLDVGDARAETSAFAELAASADWTVVIAPELGGLLLERSRHVVQLRGKLLSPHPELVELAGDKQATCQHLAAAGVAAAPGRAVKGAAAWPDDVPYPAVLKPRDGAGSQGIRLLERPPAEGPSSGLWRLEQFCAGDPASVSFLCGPTRRIALPPCRQHLSTDGRFKYLGGSCPLPSGLRVRATRLAQRAVATLPVCRGYLSVDLVLGPATDGRDDVVIEINPRMTTSYVGLRAASEANLAAAMLDVACGRASELLHHFATPVQPIQFDASGHVWHQPDADIMAMRAGDPRTS